MKRYNVILLALMTLLMLSIVSSANASISQPNWIAPLVKNENDSFYGATVTGYEAGSTATRESYNSTEASMTDPFPIKDDESHVFTVTFTAPVTTKASNMVTHTYEIYAEDVNATTGPKKLLNNNSPWYGTNFVIFSGSQANAKELKRELNKYSWYSGYFLTSKAKELYILANGAKSQGDDAYRRGDFSGASAYYQDALDNIENAWSNETGIISGFETALKNLIDSSHSVLNMVGLGYILFGTGFVLMGIGVLVYLVRKSGTPKAS